jgi:hypothetical protein
VALAEDNSGEQLGGVTYVSITDAPTLVQTSNKSTRCCCAGGVYETGLDACTTLDLHSIDGGPEAFLSAFLGQEAYSVQSSMLVHILVSYQTRREERLVSAGQKRLYTMRQICS